MRAAGSAAARSIPDERGETPPPTGRGEGRAGRGRRPGGRTFRLEAIGDGGRAARRVRRDGPEAARCGRARRADPPAVRHLATGVPRADRSVPEARKWARGLLGERVAAPVLDDVVLLLSEVVTNAVTHSGSGRDEDGRVAVRVTCDSGGVRVEVRDGGSATGAPVVRAPDIEAVGGRGLWLVDGLATAWGTWRDDAGATVWFRVAARR
ncbi:ATP-binding protein [Microbispora cellulosiformans]|uniref:ATP-binding protein n=1 Tax=Microbispora cellulosiformans TaxID=2614688 RepID=A0A5J5K8S0_9ACTN|nr:ATP-binding protein [Microbispora cellulosiformans]KAA9381380.1 ATP-binding protein [Microbispora cellulosiformans]